MVHHHASIFITDTFSKDKLPVIKRHKISFPIQVAESCQCVTLHILLKYEGFAMIL